MKLKEILEYPGARTVLIFIDQILIYLSPALVFYNGWRVGASEGSWLNWGSFFLIGYVIVNQLQRGRQIGAMFFQQKRILDAFLCGCDECRKDVQVLKFEKVPWHHYEEGPRA